MKKSSVLYLNIEIDDGLNDINSENLARAVNKMNCFDFESLEDLSESQTQDVFKIMSEDTLKMFGTPLCNLALECMEHIAGLEFYMIRDFLVES